MAGLVGLKEVRAAVQKTVEKKEGSWDDGDWSVFVEDVVSFLLKQGETHLKVVAAAAGLIVYGATTQEKLQGGHLRHAVRQVRGRQERQGAFEQRRRAGRS